jgi:L,D-transpeptidase catalytic domain
MAWSCGKSGCPTHSRPEHYCQGWVFTTLSGSVGKGGKNNRNDVIAVQGGLNRCLGPAGPSAYLATDGNPTDAFFDVIKRFQRFAVGSKKPDGKIDPGGVTYRALAAQLLRKRILVSLDAQMLWAVQDGRVKFEFPCATGDSSHPTDKGIFPIFRKRETHVSSTYNVPMNYAMFFTQDGKAVHQYHGMLGLTAVRFMKTTVSDMFGSHGCVRLEQQNANSLFNWTPLHTEVHVF